MQNICYVSHEIDFRRLQEQAKDCLDPAKVPLELLNVENSNEELGRELELKLAFPAFQLSGYWVNKKEDTMIDPFYIIGKGVVCHCLARHFSYELWSVHHLCCFYSFLF